MKQAYIYGLVMCLVLLSCNQDQTLQYHYSTFKIEHLNNSTGNPTPFITDTINPITCVATNYGLRINLYPVGDFDISNSGDLQEDYYVNKNPITNIYITSTDSFDLDLPPGNLLNEKFIYRKSLNPVDSQKTFEDNGSWYDYNTSVNGSLTTSVTDILLKHPPFHSGSYRFIVKLLFQDGTSFVDTTGSVNLY